MRSTERGLDRRDQRGGLPLGCHRVLAGADAKANFAWGLSALEVGDLSLLQHGCERGGANGFDPIGLKTTNEAGAGMVGEQACQGALTRSEDSVRGPGGLL